MSILKWHYGPMGTGKSTLALQSAHALNGCGRTGLVLSKGDRSGAARITSRMGIHAEALEVGEATDITILIAAAGPDLSWIVADEVQFYSPTQVDQLAAGVDQLGIEVHAFGIATDFAARLFPASARMFEIADECVALQATARCWCGSPARMNARTLAGSMVTTGDQVVLGDIAGAGPTGEVAYVLVCRRHYLSQQVAAPAPGRSGAGAQCVPDHRWHLRLPSRAWPADASPVPTPCAAVALAST